MLGNVGWESDGAPPFIEAGNATATTWEAYLHRAFANLPGPQPRVRVDALTAATVAALSDDFAVAPLKAYKALTTMYGLTCASAMLALAAKRGDASGAAPAFRSPFYTFINHWSPMETVWPAACTMPRWAYHTWDLKVLLESWNVSWPGHCNYQPTASDRAHSKFLQRSWYELMSTGRLTASGWQSAERATSWPRDARTMLIKESPVAVDGEMGALCAELVDSGIGQNAWWVD